MKRDELKDIIKECIIEESNNDVLLEAVLNDKNTAIKGWTKFLNDVFRAAIKDKKSLEDTEKACKKLFPKVFKNISFKEIYNETRIKMYGVKESSFSMDDNYDDYYDDYKDSKKFNFSKDNLAVSLFEKAFVDALIVAIIAKILGSSNKMAIIIGVGFFVGEFVVPLAMIALCWG